MTEGYMYKPPVDISIHRVFKEKDLIRCNVSQAQHGETLLTKYGDIIVG